jgi:hypothetical protein
MVQMVMLSTEKILKEDDRGEAGGLIAKFIDGWRTSAWSGRIDRWLDRQLEPGTHLDRSWPALCGGPARRRAPAVSTIGADLTATVDQRQPAFLGSSSPQVLDEHKEEI